MQVLLAKKPPRLAFTEERERRWSTDSTRAPRESDEERRRCTKCCGSATAARIRCARGGNRFAPVVCADSCRKNPLLPLRCSSSICDGHYVAAVREGGGGGARSAQGGCGLDAQGCCGASTEKAHRWQGRQKGRQLHSSRRAVCTVVLALSRDSIMRRIYYA